MNTQEFARLYGSRTDAQLARRFGISVSRVRKLARDMALRKNKAVFGADKMPRWSQDEIRFLRRKYPTAPCLLIARVLNRSVTSIRTKAHHLGLKKSAAYLRRMGKTNVKGRWRK